MESGKSYVLSIGNNLLEGMTKEQIIEAIAEATGETPTHIDDAFITKLKEQNRARNLKVWVGTQAEYNAIEVPATDTLYIITDVDEYEERLQAIENELEDLADLAVYSTEEKQIGKWIDGKPIYRKTVDLGTLPNNTNKDVSLDVSDIDFVVKIFGTAITSNAIIPLPYIASTLANQIGLTIRDKTTLRIATGADRSMYTGYATIEYTKAD